LSGEQASFPGIAPNANSAEMLVCCSYRHKRVLQLFSTNKNAKPFTTWKKLNLPSIYFKKCHY
jgi:hypothetical protein